MVSDPSTSSADRSHVPRPDRFRAFPDGVLCVFMAVNFYAQVSIAQASGDPADTTTNVWALQKGSEMTAQQATAWTVNLKAFYDTMNTGPALCGASTTGHLVKVYKTGGQKPNYPLFEEQFSLATAPDPVSLPREVALCVSYSNTEFPSVPRARRRGRIYIPGWVNTANAGGRPTPSAVGSLTAAFSGYMSSMVGGNIDWYPGVWSRVTQDVYPLTEAHVDNEWDTQRRRGTKPTIRTAVIMP